MILHTDLKYLWRIYVPYGFEMNKQKYAYDIAHHNKWDKKVIDVAGGLTVNKGIIGYWMNFREKMIPVDIYCTEQQIVSISDFTAKHYRQKAIMFHKLSSEVYIKEYDN